jgi:hypothetical protein
VGVFPLKIMSDLENGVEIVLDDVSDIKKRKTVEEETAPRVDEGKAAPKKVSVFFFVFVRLNKEPEYGCSAKAYHGARVIRLVELWDDHSCVPETFTGKKKRREEKTNYFCSKEQIFNNDVVTASYWNGWIGGLQVVLMFLLGPIWGTKSDALGR